MSSKAVKSAPAPKPPRRGEVCYVDKDGNVSDQVLHDEIMEGVDTDVGTRLIRESLKKEGWTDERLDVLYALNKKDGK